MTTTTNQQVADVARQLRQLIAQGQVDAGSAVGIIRAAAAVGASWDSVEAVVRELAKGADGVAGTADDLIPAQTVELLALLLHSGVVRDLAAWGASMDVAGCWKGFVSGLKSRIPCWRG